MKRFSSFILLLLGLAFYSNTYGLSSNSKCHRSTEGTDFWFGFMQGRNSSNNHFVEITVSSRVGANYKVYIGKSTIAAYSGTVASNSAVSITMDYSQVEPQVSESILNMGIHLTSDNPVNVYAYNHDNNSSDVAVIYPLESLGSAYYTMCYTPYVSTNPVSKNSEFVIVAAHNNTKVSITPTAATDGGNAANKLFTITLNKGELYQVQSLRGDLTGSYILSDSTIAVYSGSLTSIIPNPDVDPSSKNGGHDHLYEQMPSIVTWGREYYTVPFATRSKDYFRIIASMDSTTVYIGTNKIFLTKAKYVFYEFTLNAATRIYSDKPILLAQFSQARSVDNIADGDNSMMIVSPVSQAKNDVTFVAYTSTFITKYYVNIVVPVSEINNVQLAGITIPSSSFKTYSNGKYAYAQLPISAGQWRLNDTNLDRGFIAYVYGYGGNEAYSYGVGFNLNLVLDLSDGLETQPNLSAAGDSIVICKGASLNLDAGPYFDKYSWNTKDSVQEIPVSKQGEYRITASTIDGCIESDSIFVAVNDPKTYIGADKAGCSPYSITLDGGAGFNKYQWKITGDSTRQIIANKTGQYSVEAINKYGCAARDTMQLTVYPVPKVELSGTRLYCGSKTGSVDVKISGTDDSVWKSGSFKWGTDQPAKLTFKDSSFTRTSFTVSAYGNYKIFYALTTVDGCIVNDTLSVGLFQIPTSTIKTQIPGTCGDYNREVIYDGNASSNATFHWDYGGLALIKDIDWKTKLVSLGAVNSNPFVYLYVEENGCHSVISKLPVGATPNFTMNTEKSQRCDTATVTFSGKLNVPDNQLLFVWNFGDGSPVSNLQKPSHFYSAIGSYDVSLLITNKVTGCQVGFTVKDMVKIYPTPVAKMSVDPTTCYGDTIPVIYTSNIDSSICYWQFTGAHQYGKGNDSIKVILDKPVATIGLQVEEYGCKSKPITATVKRKPDFDFTAIPVEGCQPMLVDFQAARADQLLAYVWKTDTMTATGSKAELLFIRPGTYSATLAAYSTETGCRDTVVKNKYILVHPKPVSAFTVDYPVAVLGQSNLTFTNQSQLGEKYNWDFGDGFSSTDINPKHTYTERDSFRVFLYTESQFGCLDTSEFTVEIVSLDVYTPNAFRPAGNIAVNRVFMPVSHGIDADKFHLQIFNRWGEMVFESRSLENKWDGKLKNGREAPMGNYVWRADYTDIQGFNHTRRGQVLLIR